jgi:hypothetical protein
VAGRLDLLRDMRSDGDGREKGPGDDGVATAEH